MIFATTPLFRRGGLPPNRLVLFPELAATDPGDATAAVMAGAETLAARLSRGGRRVMVLTPGLLRTPPFRPGLPWISGTVTAIWQAGMAQPGWTEAALARPATAEAAALAARVVGEELGGTFWAEPPDRALLRPGRVLVRAGRDRAVATRRLQAALARSEAASILLLLDRPDPALAARYGCAAWSGPANPRALLDGAAALHTDGDDPLGWLARLAGVPVHGGPAGARDRTPDEVAAACLLGARYADPFTGQAIDCAAALDIVAEWRLVTRANRAIGACTGMSFWKRRRIAAFFHTGERAPPHRHGARAALRAAGGKAVAAWSSRIPAGLPDTLLVRVEDGFVRSLGLGSGFLPPCSVIADASGIYYDASRPSDLETLLRRTRFDPALLARTQRLMARLVREGVTKYGAGRTEVLTLPVPDGRVRILVPGQVADDLSVRLGGAGVAGNADLLARVRAANPGACIVYKPHPDVLAGHRPGAVPEREVRCHADLVVGNVSMAAVIGAVDEVHTLTSLAGFEALLRGRRVVAHGQPFYAGWGLTDDLAPIPRRDRRLSLEELCAGVLLLYPRYIDPVTELPCSPERLLDRLATPAIWRQTPLMRLRRLQGWLRA